MELKFNVGELNCPACAAIRGVTSVTANLALVWMVKTAANIAAGVVASSLHTLSLSTLYLSTTF